MKIWKRIFSVLVSACLVTGMLPTMSFAAERNGAAIGTSGLCKHHTAHDETCGYVEETAESPCTHEHGTECYTGVTSCTHTHTEECFSVLGNGVSDNDATPAEAAESTGCSHVCSASSGCIEQELNCPHEQDENCGYVPAVEGHPCTYVCELCSLTGITAWSWVDALEVIDPASGILALSGADAENPVFYDEIVDILPAEITATTEDGTETVTLDGWNCDNYPEEGACTGSYLFNAVLPEGYALAENAPALTVQVEFGGVAVLDGTEHSSHPVCGATHTDIGDHKGACEKVTWTEWNGTDEITYDTDTNTAYVYLASDVTRGDSLRIQAGKILYLCLNGHSITQSDTGEVIYIANTAKFILCNCKNDGTITHSANVLGKGVKVGTSGSNGATFIMYGGTISGNRVGTSGSGKGEDGAGVGVSNGRFTMYGGTISDNHVEFALNYGGGGIYNGDKFIMYDGEISNNTSADDGGGVMAWGTGASVTMYGGIINGNTATGNGGGICTNNSFTISGNSVIKNNEAVNGGGVYFYGYYSSDILTISDTVKIADNTATGDGGGICCKNGGALTMTNGSITGNMATGNGGGVYFNGSGGRTFTISGGVDISGNKKAGTDNNVYLSTNQYITITGKLTGDKKIGVTTEAIPDSSGYVRIATGNKSYAEPEKFQYENDGTPISAVTSRSGSTADLVVCKHSLSADWRMDSSEHWHQCAICNGKEDIAAHVYAQKVAAEGYKVSDATCTSGTIYHMSCVCGLAGTETFESGDKNPDNHTGTLGEWKSDDSKHWKEYSCCGAHAEAAAHAGGTATCQNKAVCDTCNTAYGELGSHDPAGIWSKDASGHWHVCQTANCTEQIDFAAHTPGPAATEEAPQTCTECGYEIAPALEHTHVWGNWISNGDGTHTRTCEKDNNHTETNSCSGGTATCQSPATCTICLQPYGDKDMSNHTGGTEVRGEVEATTGAEGYTGDTYCKGCNTKIEDGKTIPKKDNGSGGNGNSGSGNSGGSSGSENSSNTGDAAPAYETYIVQKGDNLWMLARKYGCTVSEIVAANSDLIKNPHLIYPGWLLKIPQDGTKGADHAPDAILPDNKKTGIYIVKRGDILWVIARKHGCTVTEIIALNRELLTDPDLIFAGWELKIPQD